MRVATGLITMASLFFIAGATLRTGSLLGNSLAYAAAESKEPLTICPVQPKDMLKELESRENAIVVQEISLSQRITALDQAESQMNASRAILEADQKKLIETYAIYDEAAAKDMQQLITIYEAMKPAAASAVFATMDPKFAAGLIVRMQTEVAAAILSNLQPAQAYEISSIVATQNSTHKNRSAEEKL